MIDPIKEFLKIEVDHPAMARSDILLRFGYRLSLIESCVLLAAPCHLGLPHFREYYARCCLLLHGPSELLHPQSRFPDM